MNQPSHDQSNGSSRSDRADKVLAEYLVRIDRGEQIEREQFLADHSEVAEELQAYFAMADQVGKALESTSESADVHATEDLCSASGDHPAEDLSLQAGECIGRYSVVREIGAGGFGRVYLAWDDVLQRHVAVKIPQSRTSLEGEPLEKWLDEARTAACLGGKGIAVVHDAGCGGNGVPFIVSQYIDGVSLKEWIDRQRATPNQISELLAQVAEAIGSAHRQGFTHRDLKPANILLDRQENPYVVDFGLAVHEAKQRRMAGQSAGTPAYMAPEQVRGETQWLDARTDIWALGVIMYEMLSGRKPFEGDSTGDIIREILARDPRPPRQIDTAIPEPMETICLRCLAKRPADRYSTARDLAKALRSWEQPARSSRRWVVLAIAISAMLLIIVAVWQALRWKDSAATRYAAAALRTMPDGAIDVFIWDEENPARRSLSVRQSGAMPLRDGDRLRIEAEVERPMYLYLLWIGSDGKVWPVYPWEGGTWENRPTSEVPLTRLSLPSKLDEGLELGGPPGMETFVLLARESPLPRGGQAELWLRSLPPQPQPYQNLLALVEFNGGQVVETSRTMDRGPKSFDPRRLADPVRQRQQLLAEGLGSEFSVFRAISVAHQGAR